MSHFNHHQMLRSLKVTLVVFVIIIQLLVVSK